MRILIVTSANYIAYHGQAIFTINLAETLLRKGHEVLVVAGSEKGPESYSVFRGVLVKSLRSISLKAFNPNAVLAIFTKKRIFEIIKEFSPDIIHIQDHYPLSHNAVRAARRMGIKIVGTNHFMPENLAEYFLLLPSDQLDAIAAPSKVAAEIVKQNRLKPPVYPISCGANTELFRFLPGIDRNLWREKYGISQGRTVFFFVGRVDQEKRLEVLINAVKHLNRQDIQFVIAGNGSKLKYLKKMCYELNLGDRVVFTGFVPNEDLPSLLNSIDVFAMPSEAELLSIATIQAMACGKPILAANAVALPELVTDGVNGYLFSPGDVADAGRCMVALTDHPERWAAMGNASNKLSHRHGLDQVISKYEKLYSLVLS
jgi:1,2-diacylglycerol 3-alpha-glucosyltransferase